MDVITNKILELDVFLSKLFLIHKNKDKKAIAVLDIMQVVP